MNEVVKIILGSTILTTLFTGIISYIFQKRTERSNAEIKREFERLSQIQNTDFELRKKTTELLGQIYLHLHRTRLGNENKYSKLEKYDVYYEDEVMYTSNKHIRDIILENGHFIPPDLLDEASKLVEHYDVWLTKFNNIREVDKNYVMVHIYVGPDGFPYPKLAEEKFKKKYIELYNSITNFG